MKYATKNALLEDIRAEHDGLLTRLAEFPAPRWREPGVWGDGWTLNDLVAHLAEWHQMFLGWHEEGLRGHSPVLPAPGYKWSQLPALNRAIQEKHRARSRAAVQSDFDAGYDRIVRLVEELSPKQLLEPGHFAWTGKNSLTTYLGASTASHYRFASKVIQRWQKGKLRTAPSKRHD